MEKQGQRKRARPQVPLLCEERAYAQDRSGKAPGTSVQWRKAHVPTRKMLRRPNSITPFLARFPSSPHPIKRDATSFRMDKGCDSRAMIYWHTARVKR